MYFISSSEKDQRININKEDYVVSPRSYIRVKIHSGEVYRISTKKLLGSTIRLQPKNEGDQYFQISSTRITSDDSGVGGLRLKTGDIIGLERSYGEYLRVIYKDINKD